MESPSINLLADAFERYKQTSKFNLLLGQMRLDRFDADNDRLRRWMVTGQSEQVARSERPANVPYRKNAPRRLRLK